jgi:hypothetical protein
VLKELLKDILALSAISAITITFIGHMPDKIINEAPLVLVLYGALLSRLLSAITIEITRAN